MKFYVSIVRPIPPSLVQQVDYFIVEALDPLDAGFKAAAQVKERHPDADLSALRCDLSYVAEHGYARSA